MKQKARPQTRTTALRDQNVIQFHIYRNKNKLLVTTILWTTVI